MHAPAAGRHPRHVDEVQVDIFSLAIIIYELFSMCPLVKTVSQTGSEDEFEQYANRVACGHREPIDASWPQQLQVPTPCGHIRALRCMRVPVTLRLPSGRHTHAFPLMLLNA